MITIDGVKLQLPQGGISRVEVLSPAAQLNLTWDRYVRLAAAARAFRKHSTSQAPVLDVGGFDGALALFLPECAVDVIDPDTTGGDIFKVPAATYEAVFAIDVVEHVEPRQRCVFLTQLARVAKHMCILNFPIPDSATAQKLVAALTDDPFVQEHVQYGLPYSSTVARQLEEAGMSCTSHRHTSRSVWATYMALRSCDAGKAQQVSRYLIEEHAQDEVPDPLYETIVARRD